MPQSNFEKMLALAEEVFATKNDPDQLDVDWEIIERLKAIHPATVSEKEDGDGPVAWVLLIPTTTELMNEFLTEKISEKELFEKTPAEVSFEAIYLCSALVLKEFRRKGIAKRLALKAVESIRKEYPIKALFVWAFSKEGDEGSAALAKIVGLPLFRRANR